MRRFALLFSITAAAAAAAPVTLIGDPGFEENKGQFRAGVLYALRPGAYLTANSLVLAPEQVAIRFDGANQAVAITPADPVPYKVNVYSGSDPAKWITGIQRFRQVRYSSIYPGIDMLVVPAVTYRFVVSPGASSAAIKLRFEGAQVTLREGGTTVDIPMKSSGGGQSVIAYQDGTGGRTSIPAQYTQIESGLFGVSVGAYDSSRPLTVEFTKPTGASAPRAPWPWLTVSRSGNIYGVTSEQALVTAPRAEGDTCGDIPEYTPSPCSETVLFAYRPSGEPAYASYMSGAKREVPAAVTVDDAERVWIGGRTESADFPVTPDAIQKNYAGGPAVPYTDAAGVWIFGDAFLAQFDGATGTLTYSTYLGGPDGDTITALRLDSAGNVYAGGPSGSGLPVTPGAFRNAPCAAMQTDGTRAPCVLGFLAKVGPDGRLGYLTYLPGAPTHFDVDPAGNAYFTGTSTGDLPRIPGAYRMAPEGARDLFVAKLISTGTTLGYATYYPASDGGYINDIAADKQGGVWLNARDPYPYLVKLSADGSKLAYGPEPTFARSLKCDPAGNLNIASISAGAPYDSTIRTSGGLLTEVCGSVTLSKLDPNGVVLANKGVAGTTPPLLTNDGSALMRSSTSGVVLWDIVPIETASLPDVSCMLDGASLRPVTKVAPGGIVTLYGRGLKDASVQFNGSSAPVLYTDDGQVNAIVPYRLQPGSVPELKVEAQGRSTSIPIESVVAAQPALFTLDGSGAGQLLALNEDGTVNGFDQPAHAGGSISLFANGMGALTPAVTEGVTAAGQSQPATPYTIDMVDQQSTRYPVEVLRASTVPGLLNSIVRIDLRIPVFGFQFPSTGVAFSFNGGAAQWASVIVAH